MRYSYYYHCHKISYHYKIKHSYSLISILIFLSALITCTCNSPFTECNYDNQYKKGINIFFLTDSSTRNRFEENDFQESVIRLKSIGINTVFLTPSYFTPNAQSDSIYFDSTLTIPDTQLCQAISIAKSYGLDVVLKPHLNCSSKENRYTINPFNYSRWLINYKCFAEHYISISQKYKLSSFVIATELDSVVEKNGFIAFCDSVRKSSGLKIIYSSSFNHFISTKLWQHVDIMGINAYFNLDNSIPPLQSNLHESWNYWLNLLTEYSNLKNKPVIITEVGYMSRENAAKNPGDFSKNYSLDINVQKDCYEALLSQACKFDRIKGIIFWQWELGKKGGIIDSDYTPRDKPAENTIKKYWIE